MLIARFWISFSVILIVTHPLLGQGGYGVMITKLPDTVPLGSSIPLEFTLINESKMELPLRIDGWGRPATTMDLLAPDGKSVQAKSPGSAGFRPLPEAEFYRQKPGERLRFAFDLTSLYSITSPGTYVLRFTGADGRALSEAQITASTFTTTSQFELSGYYQPPFIGTPRGGGQNTSVRLALVQTQPAQSSTDFILIDRIRVLGEAREDLPRFAFGVPVGTSIEKCEMDYSGQVWALVKIDRRMSLVVWRIDDLSWTVLIPFGEQNIEFNSSRARFTIPAAEQKIVIAGVEGKEKFTTHSIRQTKRDTDG